MVRLPSVIVTALVLCARPIASFLQSSTLLPRQRASALNASTKPNDKGGDLDRRAALLCGFAPLLTAALTGVAAPVVAEGLAEGLVTETYEDLGRGGGEREAAAQRAASIKTRRYVDKKIGYALEYPVGWTLSPRKPKKTGLLKDRVGTTVAMGDYTKGCTLSVTVSSMRDLLKETGYYSGGSMMSFNDILKAKGNADLLMRQRDGNVKQKNPLTRVFSASQSDKQLDFTVELIVKMYLTGNAPSGTPDAIPQDPVIRRTDARAFLLGDVDGEVITVWASALADQWDSCGPDLKKAIDSFEVVAKT